MTKKKASARQIEKRILEAHQILIELGLPEDQTNKRSALTLLALLGLKPLSSWSEASAPLMGITPMMSFFSRNYKINYAPNSRETVRRFTVHQFLQAGLITANPDDPSRPTNSPKAVYQIEPAALELIKSFGSTDWKENLVNYLSIVDSLRLRYAQEREMQRISVIFNGDQALLLSSGAHNDLIKQIIEGFCPRFTPGGEIIYVGDTEKKWAYFNSDLLSKLNVSMEAHGKMPDVAIFYSEKNWLVLVEAVTSHGPVNAKRHLELLKLFQSSTAGLVFVTAFQTRNAMGKYLSEISWETEVWIADNPSHMIHFNGERFLGPYENHIS